jgi:hypothetical protein
MIEGWKVWLWLHLRMPCMATCSLCFFPAIVPDTYMHCERCDKLLVWWQNRGEARHYFPAGTGSVAGHFRNPFCYAHPGLENADLEPPVPVHGSRNEAIATKPRTREESIRYASKVPWLDWCKRNEHLGAIGMILSYLRPRGYGRRTSLPNPVTLTTSGWHA